MKLWGKMPLESLVLGVAVNFRTDTIYNQDNRIGRLFATSLIRAVAECRLNSQDAYYLTGLKEKSLQRYARELGLMYP